MIGDLHDGLSAEINYGAPILEDWPDANRYTVTIRYQQRAMTVPFYTAPAWGREPELGDVMDCLRSDAVGVMNVSCFEEWADELGFDSDSRRAETTYGQVRRQTEELRQLLGDDFDEIVFSNGR
jgi:hypothetical protein